MVSEQDIQAQLRVTDDRLYSIGTEIKPLQQQVADGTEGWQQALARLADCYSRRRALEVRRDSLTWVLS